MKLLQYQAKSRQVPLLNRSIGVAVERFADQFFDLALHCSQFL
jgi:hypothetical protein